MISLQMAFLVITVGAAPEALLLDFQADWCGPCRQMEPVVEKLAQRGYPLRRVNVDDEPQLAERFGVTGVPCFVLLVDGHEVDRIVGATTVARLQRMFQQAGYRPGTPSSGGLLRGRRRLAQALQPRVRRGQSPDAAMVPVVMPSSRSSQPLGASPAGGAAGRPFGSRPTSRSMAADAVRPGLGKAPRWQGAATQSSVQGQSPPLENQSEPSRQPFAASPPVPAAPGAASASTASGDLLRSLMEASVRIRVEDNDGRSVGSGTIIDADEGEALVVTCGHIFRDRRQGGFIEVDLFGPGNPRTVPGRLISHDLKSDVGLVAIRTDGPVTTARLAPHDYTNSVGGAVINIGCNNGADPTARKSQITSIDKFVGPPNVQVAGQPASGRSGGGLFTADGLMIGVCNAADPMDNEGLYAALASIHAQLAQSGITPILERPLSAAGGQTLVAQAAPPPMPQRMPLGNGEGHPSASQPYRPGSTSSAGSGAAAIASAVSSTAATSGQRGPMAPAMPVASQPVSQLPERERAALDEIRSAQGWAEVICVIRPLDDPKAKTEIIVLDRASPGFIEQLTAASRAPSGPQLTSLELRGNDRRENRTAPSQPRPGTTSGARVPSRVSPGSWQPNRN